MKRTMRFLICASAAALILGAAPTGAFIAPAQAQVAVSITAGIAPPLLPVYAQPPIPGPGYMWIPGYWAWNGYEYYWVPGYWELPPAVGLYWTPPYWAFVDGAYDFYPGYWGPTVGFYGGIDYGFGYTGVGYDGGYWRNDQFVYNSAVNNFGDANIVYAYSRPVANPNNRVAFSGGAGGMIARPTRAQIGARAHATPPTAEQVRHQEMASRDPALRFNANHGQPHIAAMQRANKFHGAHTVAATKAPATAAAAAAASAPAGAHALTAHPRVAEHAPAHPRVAEHAPAHPRVAEHAPARPHVAYHGPARNAVIARRHFAYHAPARHAVVARPHFAYHAPAAHMGAMRAPHFGAMRMGGAPHFGGMRMGGAPHMGAMRMGAAPHFGGAPHGGGGGARHIP
jgi:YXWGXW repeat-containing protein